MAGGRERSGKRLIHSWHRFGSSMAAGGSTCSRLPPSNNARSLVSASSGGSVRRAFCASESCVSDVKDDTSGGSSSKQASASILHAGRGVHHSNLISQVVWPLPEL